MSPEEGWIIEEGANSRNALSAVAVRYNFPSIVIHFVKDLFLFYLYSVHLIVIKPRVG